MKSQIFKTFLIVLVAQSQVAFAEPQPLFGVLEGLVGTGLDVIHGAANLTSGLLGVDGVVGGLVGPDGLLGGLTGDDGILDELLLDGGLLGQLTGDNGLLGGLLGDEGLLGGILDSVLDLVVTLLSAVQELLNNLFNGLDSALTDITANASNTLEGNSGKWNDTLATAPLVMEKAVEDAHQLISNITDTLSSSIINAIGNQLTLDSSIIDTLKNIINNIADDFVIPDVIDKLLVTFGTVTCSVFDSVLNALEKIPNIPEGVTDSIENSCTVLNQTVFGVMNQKDDMTNPSLEPLKTIALMLLDILKSIVTATGVSDLIGTNPDISTIEISLTPTTNDLLLDFATNLNYANSFFEQAIPSVRNTANAAPDLVNNGLKAVFSLIPNTNCSNNIESSKASLTDNSISNATECANTAITSLQGIMNQYSSIINDINSSTSTGFLNATSLDLYIKIVANSGAAIFNIIFGHRSCLGHGSGLAITEFVKLIVDSIHCLASPA